MPEPKKENLYPPLESGERRFWAVEYWVEGNLGIVALAGTIDYDQGPAVLAAADALIKNRAVDSIVFDFFNAIFFHTAHMDILKDIHERTLGAGSKTFMLCSPINPNFELDNTDPDITSTSILQLLRTNGNLAIEGEDPPHVLARKLNLGRYKPHGH